MRDVERNVKAILENSIDARNDDYKLYALYVMEHHEEVLKLPFTEIMFSHKEIGLPSFETVTRARRRLQEKFLHLRATNSTRRKRKTAEQNFIDYARSH